MDPSKSGPSSNAERDREQIDRSFRSESARAVATLARIFGDLQRAEDAVQEAYVTAVERWAIDGTPRNPAAWILRTARNRAIDQLRREKSVASKYELLARLEDVPVQDTPFAEEPIGDDRLAMIFACCHPALSTETRLALTLRYAAGLPAEEIASAFLVPLPTLAQRLVRAKKKIIQAGIPFAVPAPAQFPDRLNDVLTILYLVFNEGYYASRGSALIRAGLCAEALHLVSVLERLLPSEPEVLALHALMLFAHSRRSARVNDRGEAVPMEEQDRERWDVVAIAQGRALLERAARYGQPGTYELQASIACAHAVAMEWAATDWPAILRAYDLLYAMDPSPVVALNRAVAVAYVHGFAQGLNIVDDLLQEPALHHYAPALVAKAELLRRHGATPQALECYQRALPLVTSQAERRLLTRRIHDLQGAPPRGA